MNTVYVLIVCEVGAEESILAELKSLESAKDVTGLFGSYDIIVKLEGGSEEKLKDIVVSKIQNLKKIRTTITLRVKEI